MESKPGSGGAEAVERMLSRAFAPVDPPAHLYDKLEARLEHAAFAAAEDLSDWELAAMRDPRNWVKPATAAVVGGAAAGALVVMHLRSRNKKDDRSKEALKALRDAFSDVGDEVKRSAKSVQKRVDRK